MRSGRHKRQRLSVRPIIDSSLRAAFRHRAKYDQPRGLTPDSNRAPQPLTSVPSPSPSLGPNPWNCPGQRVIAHDAGNTLHAAAKATGEFGHAAQWAENLYYIRRRRERIRQWRVSAGP